MYVVSLPFDLEAIVLMSLSFTGFLGFSVLVTITFRLASALLYKEHSVRNRLSLISFFLLFYLSHSFLSILAKIEHRLF